MLLCVHTPGPLGGLSLLGWPTVPHSGCLVECSLSLIVPTLPPLFAKWNITLCAALPPAPPPPQGTLKVSWTAAQINVTSDPAGVVSGSAGQCGGQAHLCPTEAACGSVSLESHNHISDRGVNRPPQLLGCSAPWEWTTKEPLALKLDAFFFFFAEVRTACTWPVVSGPVGVASS